MKVAITIIMLFLLITACRIDMKEDISGNWYLDLGDPGPFDSTSNYQEFYLSDSLFTAPDILADQLQRYFVKADTIFISDMLEKSNFRAYYEIISLGADTLRLRYVPKSKFVKDTVYWVRLSSSVRGYFDYTDGQSNRDSIIALLIEEYQARRKTYNRARGIER